ncbi:MAG: NTP transferase domain-containing protein [Candidatus Aenigmarchaeota archaeon]|nr:NTP transferase domain-containing protein [Candidatus Aenigmarchaeota archaeon]
MTQAVILAAGESSRFWPLSEGKHKSLNNIMGKPLIQHTIDSIKSAGIKDIIIIQGPGREIEKVVKDPDVRFVVQKEPKGMGDALSQARELLKRQFFVLGAHHVDASEFLTPMMDTSKKNGAALTLLGRETDTPWIYGVLNLKNNFAKGIVEKPERGKEPSNIKAVSIYLLHPEFFDYLDMVPQHHYNYEEALDLYMKKNDVPVFVTDKDTVSLKYPWHMLDVVKRLMKNMSPFVADSADIHPSVEINGNVYIGENTRIFRGATINGPCYIGNNVLIGNNTLIRDYTNIEDDVMIGMGAEVTRTIIQRGTHTHSGFFGDSIIGEDCRIGAGTITADVRIDRGIINATVKGKKVETGRKSLGVIVGNNTRTGISVRFMPGVLVGSNCTIGPNTVVMENLESNTLLYTKFQEVKKKKK